MAPSVLADTPITFQLKVTDSAGMFATATTIVTVVVNPPITGTIAPDAAPLAVNLAASQKAFYTFSGSLYQALSVRVTGLSTNPSGGIVSFTVTKPDGSTLRTFSARPILRISFERFFHGTASSQSR